MSIQEIKLYVAWNSEIKISLLPFWSAKQDILMIEKSNKHNVAASTISCIHKRRKQNLLSLINIYIPFSAFHVRNKYTRNIFVLTKISYISIGFW